MTDDEWIANVTEQARRERIVRAAARFDNAVYSVPQPGRHYHCFALGAPVGADQGFLTSTGRFVDRVEACMIAAAADQLKNRTKTGNPNVLYSEDLW